MWVVTRHQNGISTLVAQTSFSRGNQWWRRKMSTVFSGCLKRRVRTFHVLVMLRQQWNRLVTCACIIVVLLIKLVTFWTLSFPPQSWLHKLSIETTFRALDCLPSKRCIRTAIFQRSYPSHPSLLKPPNSEQTSLFSSRTAHLVLFLWVKQVTTVIIRLTALRAY